MTWFFNSPRLVAHHCRDPQTRSATNLVVRTQPTTTCPWGPSRQCAWPWRTIWGTTMTGFNGTVTIAIGRNGGLLIPGDADRGRGPAPGRPMASPRSLTSASISPGNGYTLRVTASGLLGAEEARLQHRLVDTRRLIMRTPYAFSGLVAAGLLAGCAGTPSRLIASGRWSPSLPSRRRVNPQRPLQCHAREHLDYQGVQSDQPPSRRRDHLSTFFWTGTQRR